MSAPTAERPLAVVTGASSGIGFELARQFAEHGFDLLIAAEDEGIERAGADLRRDGGPQVRTCRVDLATYDGVEQLYQDIERTGRPVEAIAINAGRGAGGDFARDTDLRDELKDTGVTVTALMPGPTDTNFFERADMTGTKVGAGPKDDPAKVAEQGFKALMDGNDHVVAGSFKNKVQAVAAKAMPDTAKAEMHRKMAEPGSGQ